jgi:hypothetical protein
MRCKECRHYKPSKVRGAINLDLCKFHGKLCTELNYGRTCFDFANVNLEIELFHNREPTCPHCGHGEADWWEHGDDIKDGNDFKIECGSCEKEFEVTVCIETTFTTTKPKEAQDEG